MSSTGNKIFKEALVKLEAGNLLPEGANDGRLEVMQRTSLIDALVERILFDAQTTSLNNNNDINSSLIRSEIVNLRNSNENDFDEVITKLTELIQATLDIGEDIVDQLIIIDQSLQTLNGLTIDANNLLSTIDINTFQTSSNTLLIYTELTSVLSELVNLSSLTSDNLAENNANAASNLSALAELQTIVTRLNTIIMNDSAALAEIELELQTLNSTSLSIQSLLTNDIPSAINAVTTAIQAQYDVTSTIVQEDVTGRYLRLVTWFDKTTGAIFGEQLYEVGNGAMIPAPAGTQLRSAAPVDLKIIERRVIDSAIGIHNNIVYTYRQIYRENDVTGTIESVSVEWYDANGNITLSPPAAWVPEEQTTLDYPKQNLLFGIEGTSSDTQDTVVGIAQNNIGGAYSQAIVSVTYELVQLNDPINLPVVSREDGSGVFKKLRYVGQVFTVDIYDQNDYIRNLGLLLPQTAGLGDNIVEITYQRRF